MSREVLIVYQMEEPEREWPHLKDSHSLVTRHALSASHLSRFHGSLVSRTFICQNSENHWPEPTRKEAPPALLLEDADDPSVLSS